MPYVEKTTWAGKTVEKEKYFTARYNKKGVTRNQKQKPTSEEMLRINEANAEKKLRREINTNFGHGDLHITLTYQKDERLDPAEAKKELERYIRKIRKLYKKLGEELRYITVTEYKNKGIHHHIIVNVVDGVKTKELVNAWEKGRPKFTYLDDSGQYGALAQYLIKETRKTFREEGSPSRKRWNSSRNLKKPKTKVEIVKAKEWRKEPKALKGYILEKDSIREGYHDFTGWPFQCYSMVRIEERKRYRNDG